MRDALNSLALPGPFGGRRFNPASMFRATSAGLLLRSSLLDTLSQDAAGTTPANAPGQPVGLVRDLSGGWHHASQVTSTARPTLGRHPRSGRRNMLVQSNTLATSPWGAGSGLLSVTNSAAAGVSGGMTATLLVENTASSSARNRVQGLNVTSGQYYTMSAIVKSVGPAQRHAHLVFESGAAFGSVPSATLNMLTGAITQSGGTNRTAGADNLGNGWWRLWMRAQCVADGSNGFRVGFSDNATSPYNAYTGDGLSGLAVDGVQVETVAGMTAQQTTTTQYDMTEAGQPDVWYLSSDAIDDFLTTAAFDWGSDEVTIVAALRKRSDAAEGSLVSFTSGGDPGFRMAAPGGSSAWKFWSASKGSVETFAVDTNTARSAPFSAVVAMQGKVSTDTNALRVNGAQVATSSSDQGVAATYGTQQVFIGRQGGASYPAAMDLYALFAINRVLTAAELAQVERWAASEMGVTL